MADVLKIAKKHWKAKKNAPVGVITIQEWLDDDLTPVSMDVRRLSSTELAEISAAQRGGGDRSGQVMTIIKACYEPGLQKRVFSDTDQKALLEDVDPDLIQSIHDQIWLMFRGEVTP